MKREYRFKRALRATFITLFATIALTGAKGQLAPETKERIDEIFIAWDTAWTPGVAVAVVHDGNLVYSNGYGLANLEYDIPVTPTTVFHIASVSKQFTTFAILLLEREGKLSLDDEVQKHIPELADFGVPVTLRQMAHNTSGLRDQWNLLGMAGWRLDDVITTDQVLRLLSRQRELNFTPGDQYMYSNTGFTLLAEVVARVSGQSFAEFTKENIFDPLGMDNTLFYDDHRRIVRNRAYSYGRSGDGYNKRVLSYATVGATSLFTTVEDLALWALNFENPIVGDHEVIEKMNRRGIFNNGREGNYALGQSIGTYRNLNMISHGGADAGYRSFFARFPDQRTSVIVFSNDASFNSNRMAMRVASVVLEDHIEDTPPREEREEREIPEGVKLPQATLERYTGHFMLQPDNYAIITLDDDTLYYHTTSNRRRTSLIPLSDTEFITETGGSRINFETDRRGEPVRLILRPNRDSVTAERVEPFIPEEADLDQYTGEYYSQELDITYILTVSEGRDGNRRLTANHVRLGTMTMSPLTPDHFSAGQWFINRVTFIRDENGEINGARMSGSRVRNLWFEKR